MSCEGCVLKEIGQGSIVGDVYPVGYTPLFKRIYRSDCPRCSSGSINLLGEVISGQENTYRIRVEKTLNILDCDPKPTVAANNT